MKPSIRNLSVPASALALAALLFGCLGDAEVAGTSTETITGKTTGLVILADGKPAKRATVKVFPVGYRPVQDSLTSAAFRTETDEMGRYYLDSLARGEYNILGSLDGQSAYQDSIFISGTPKALDTLFLDDPGVVSGYVALQAGDPLPTATVQVLGTQAYANVNTQGFFRLPALAPGVYRLAVSTTLPDYTPYYGDIEVRAGVKDTLADTLRPFFTGIPLATGLKAVFDTLEGVVHLSWDASDFVNLDRYLVYRDIEGSSMRSTTPIAVVKNTVYSDRLSDGIDFNGGFGGVFADSILHLEYRVALRDKFGYPGRTFGALDVDAPPPSQVLTAASLQAIGLKNGAASIGDSITLVVEYRNPTRKVAQIEWSVQGLAAPARHVRPGRSEGKDTLKVKCPGQAGMGKVIAWLSDDGDITREVSLSFPVLIDRPKVELSGGGIAAVGTTFELSAPATDAHGSVVKWEWDIGATGTFVAGSRDTAVKLPATPVKLFACVVRVTDDDGLTATDTVVFRVTHVWKKGTSPPFEIRNTAVTGWNGKIYFFGGQILSGGSWEATAKAFSWDPSTGQWDELPSMSRPKLNSRALATDSAIYVIGGMAPDPQSASGFAYTSTMEAFDPEHASWAGKATLWGVRQEFQPEFHAGKIHLIGGTGLLQSQNITYNPATDIWSYDSRIYPNPDYSIFAGFLATASLGNSVFILSHEGANTYPLHRMSNTPTEYFRLPSTKLQPGHDLSLRHPAFASGAGKLFLAGGVVRYEASDRILSERVQAYDPAEGVWSDWTPFPKPRHVDHLITIGNRLYAIGASEGGRNATADPLLVEWLDLSE